MTASPRCLEPQLRGYLPPSPFQFGEGALIHEILRLLTGSANVRLGEQAAAIERLRVNHLRSAVSITARPETLISALFDDPVPLDEYATFSLSASRTNQRFFSTLRDELSLCLVARKNDRLTESFLFMFRMLEHMSLAFPFLYASAQRDFSRSFDFLRSLLASEKDSDLKVIQRAMPTLVSGSNLELLVFDFSISGREANFVGDLKNELNRNVQPSVKDMTFETQGDILFSVPFLSMTQFIVTLRNRMFHFKVGQPNIDLSKFGGSESVLAVCIDNIIYWFALTFTELTRTLARAHF